MQSACNLHGVALPHHNNPTLQPKKRSTKKSQFAFLHLTTLRAAYLHGKGSSLHPEKESEKLSPRKRIVNVAFAVRATNPPFVGWLGPLLCGTMWQVG
jgi:hypothetical protein